MFCLRVCVNCAQHTDKRNQMKYTHTKITGGKADKRLSETLSELKDGHYNVFFTEFRKTPSRYKFYWGYVLPAILLQAGHLFQIDGQDVRSTNQLHEILKAIYNSGTVLDTTTGQTMRVSISTTTLNDDQFINQFQERIMSDFAQEYGVEFDW